VRARSGRAGLGSSGRHPAIRGAERTTGSGVVARSTRGGGDRRCAGTQSQGRRERKAQQVGAPGEILAAEPWPGAGSSMSPRLCVHRCPRVARDRLARFIVHTGPCRRQVADEDHGRAMCGSMMRQQASTSGWRHPPTRKPRSSRASRSSATGSATTAASRTSVPCSSRTAIGRGPPSRPDEASPPTRLGRLHARRWTVISRPGRPDAVTPRGGCKAGERRHTSTCMRPAGAADACLAGRPTWPGASCRTPL